MLLGVPGAMCQLTSSTGDIAVLGLGKVWVSTISGTKCWSRTQAGIGKYKDRVLPEGG